MWGEYITVLCKECLLLDTVCLYVCGMRFISLAFPRLLTIHTRRVGALWRTHIDWHRTAITSLYNSDSTRERESADEREKTAHTHRCNFRSFNVLRKVCPFVAVARKQTIQYIWGWMGDSICFHMLARHIVSDVVASIVISHLLVWLGGRDTVVGLCNLSGLSSSRSLRPLRLE